VDQGQIKNLIREIKKVGRKPPEEVLPTTKRPVSAKKSYPLY
jgi:hypothetical protein